MNFGIAYVTSALVLAGAGWAFSSLQKHLMDDFLGQITDRTCPLAPSRLLTRKSRLALIQIITSTRPSIIALMALIDEDPTMVSQAIFWSAVYNRPGYVSSLLRAYGTKCLTKRDLHDAIALALEKDLVDVLDELLKVCEGTPADVHKTVWTITAGMSRNVPLKGILGKTKWFSEHFGASD